MFRRVMLIILTTFLLIQPFANADSLPTTFAGGTSKSVVYPNLGQERSTDPSVNFYYVIHYDLTTRAHIKTEEFRTADDQLMRIAYPDKSIVVISTDPLTKEEVSNYSKEYGYVVTESKKSEPEYTALAKDLLKDKKVVFFTNTDNRTGYRFIADQRVIALVKLIAGDKVDDLKKTYFSKVDLTEIEGINKSLRALKNVSMNIEVMIIPYSSEKFKDGLIVDLKSDGKDKVMILFNNNDKSIKDQYELQLEKYLEEAAQ